VHAPRQQCVTFTVNFAPAAGCHFYGKIHGGRTPSRRPTEAIWDASLDIKVSLLL
jgi:hypothetical protein